MKFRVQHITHYHYDARIADSVNEIRLSPRTNGRQSCYQHMIVTTPYAPLYSYEDYFGNRVHAFSVAKPHKDLTICANSIVVTKERNETDTNVLPYNEEVALLKSESFADQFAEYLAPTEYTQRTEQVKQIAASLWARKSFTSVSDLLETMTRMIKTDYLYDPSATHVHTKVDEMIKLQRGVCQDFAHLMIALCRTLSIPSRYISGYQYILDLSGANADFEQASHAWVEAYIPKVGWTGYDPTNDVPIDWRYIVLAHGRDYKDIVPVKGVYRGTPNQMLDVTVNVEKID